MAVGVWLRREAAPIIRNCFFDDVESWGLYHQSSLTLRLYGNTIKACGGGVYSFGAEIDARFVDWGDSSGPYHATLNPDGLGNRVSDHVLFIPWGNNPDSDNDGIDDRWELDNFGNLTVANQHTDFDKDGYSDLFEYQHANEVDPDGKYFFDPKYGNEPHVACVNINGGSCYLSLEAVIEDYAQDYPNEPLQIDLIKNQRCNVSDPVLFNNDTTYFLCGGFDNDFREYPSGFSSICGTVTISVGKVVVENIIIGE